MYVVYFKYALLTTQFEWEGVELLFCFSLSAVGVNCMMYSQLKYVTDAT